MKELIAARLAIPAAERRRLSQRIAAGLDQALGDVSGRIVSAYWPFRGEPDLRPWLEGLEERGAVGSLPVVVHRHAPLVFRSWRRDEPLEPGVWKIPVPSHGIAVTPDIVIAPVVGFDTRCFRLGYGGGFYDRTLAGPAAANPDRRGRLRAAGDPDDLSAGPRRGDGNDRHRERHRHPYRHPG